MIKNKKTVFILSLLGLFIFSFVFYHGVNEYFEAKKINIFRLSLSFTMIIVLVATCINILVGNDKKS